MKLALVGCGTISQLNAPGYLQYDKCDVVALCDPNRERAEYRAKQWGISPKIYTEYEDVLNDSNIDAVELLTPTHLHPRQIIQGLEAGKHVSSQKPISSTLAETDEVAAVVEKSRAKFRITENFISYPPIVKAKELLDAGVIGDPSMIRIRTVKANLAESNFDVHPEASVWRNNPDLHAGGMLYDDGWHKYATAIWWIGDIEQVQSIVTKNDEYLDDTPSAAIWKFKDKNCLGVFDYSSAPEMYIRGKYYPADEFFEIQGSKGAIYVTRCTGEMLDLPPVMVVKGTETTGIQVPMDWLEGFSGAARHFIDCILQDEQPRMDVQFSKHTLQVAMAMYESSNQKRPIDPATLV